MMNEGIEKLREIIGIKDKKERFDAYKQWVCDYAHVASVAFVVHEEELLQCKYEKELIDCNRMDKQRELIQMFSLVPGWQVYDLPENKQQIHKLEVFCIKPVKEE